MFLSISRTLPRHTFSCYMLESFTTFRWMDFAHNAKVYRFAQRNEATNAGCWWDSCARVSHLHTNRSSFPSDVCVSNLAEEIAYSTSRSSEQRALINILLFSSIWQMCILCKMLVSYDYIDIWLSLSHKIQLPTSIEPKLRRRRCRRRWLGAKAERNKRGSSHCNCHRCSEHPTMCLGAYSISIPPAADIPTGTRAYACQYNDTSHPIKRYFERAPLMIAERDRLYSYILTNRNAIYIEIPIYCLEFFLDFTYAKNKIHSPHSDRYHFTLEKNAFSLWKFHSTFFDCGKGRWTKRCVWKQLKN